MKLRPFWLTGTITMLMALLTACGPTINQIKPQQTVTVNKSFQSQVTAPSAPTYICGAWASDNAPASNYSTISIIAKLTKNITGVSGVTAKAVVHFKNSDVELAQQPVSDQGGYVTFILPIQGRQPYLNPATVDVSFLVNNTKVDCSRAFFTPR